MTILIIKSVISLIFVCGLLYILLRLLSKFNKSTMIKSNNNPGSITIVSVSYLDSNSKIVNFSCKNKNYLVLLGKNNDLIIDTYEENKI